MRRDASPRKSVAGKAAPRRRSSDRELQKCDGARGRWEGEGGGRKEGIFEVTTRVYFTVETCVLNSFFRKSQVASTKRGSSCAPLPPPPPPPLSHLENFSSVFLIYGAGLPWLEHYSRNKTLAEPYILRAARGAHIGRGSKSPTQPPPLRPPPPPTAALSRWLPHILKGIALWVFKTRYLCSVRIFCQP